MNNKMVDDDDIEWKYISLIFKNLTIWCATDGKVLRLRHFGMIPVEISLEDKEEIDKIYITEDIVFNEYEGPAEST